jgi:hypothetical protein
MNMPACCQRHPCLANECLSLCNAVAAAVKGVQVDELRKAKERPAVGDAKQLTLNAVSQAIRVTVHLKNQLMSARTSEPSDAAITQAAELVDEELRESMELAHGHPASDVAVSDIADDALSV